MRRASIIAILIASSACAWKQGGPNAPGEGEPWIAKVVVDGNESFSDSEILEGLVTHKPTGLILRSRVRYDPALIETDSRRIETFYQQKGFFEAAVVDVATKDKGKAARVVTFAVSEGEPSLVTAVEIEGLTDAEKAELGPATTTGKRFDYGEFLASKDRMIAPLRDHGYAHARLSARAIVDRSKRSVVLRYEVERGPLVRVGEVFVRGLEIVPESAVTNRLDFGRGDVFSARAVASSRAQLRGLGRFGVVRIDFVGESKGEVADVAVTVREGPRREVRLGGGAALDGGASFDNAQWLVRARAGYTLHGVIDGLTTLDTELRPGVSLQTRDGGTQSIVGEARVSLSREDLFIPQLKGVGSVGYDVRAFDAFTSRGPGARLGVERPLWRRRIKTGLGWQIELLCFSGRPDILKPGSETYDAALAESLGVDRSCGTLDLPRASSYRLGLVEGTVALDMRDDLLDTRSGYYLDASFEGAAAFGGSEFNYAKLTGESRGYASLSPRVVIAARARYGRAVSGTLPITRRFFSGGASSQRGFGQRQLAPVAGDITTSDVEIGGDELFESTLEARLDAFKLWGAVIGIALFADAGDVLLASETLSLGDLHVALGGGLRYRTPIGPFRLDVAYRATRTGAGQIHGSDSYAWHLSIGEAF